MLKNLLDNLLLLNKESTDDLGTDTGSTLGSSVGAGDGLLTLGETSVLTGSEGRDLYSREIKKMEFEFT